MNLNSHLTHEYISASHIFSQDSYKQLFDSKQEMDESINIDPTLASLLTFQHKFLSIISAIQLEEILNNNKYHPINVKITPLLRRFHLIYQRLTLGAYYIKICKDHKTYSDDEIQNFIHKLGYIMNKKTIKFSGQLTETLTKVSTLIVEKTDTSESELKVIVEALEEAFKPIIVALKEGQKSMLTLVTGMSDTLIPSESFRKTLNHLRVTLLDCVI